LAALFPAIVTRRQSVLAAIGLIRPAILPVDHARLYKLRRAQRTIQSLESKVVQVERRAEGAQKRAASVNKQYKRIRDRVKNGVCPCCNRTFTNLADHMRTQHANFGSTDLLKALREAYGMTQTALAEEVWVSPQYISLFERGKSVPEHASSKIETWLTAQTA